jgi:transposase
MQGKVLPEERGAQPVYVGIDVCKTHLDVHLHPLGRRLKVANARDGIRRLKRLLADHAVALVAMEATARYHRAVQRSLYQAGFAVAVVNPLRARLFAEAAGALAKTDRVDAKMLAILAETLGPRATPPAPEALEALQELVHARSAALAERTALANRLAASHTDGHIARLEAGIARRIAAEPGLARRHQILVSIPGVGPVVAATLLADLPELGAIDRRAVASLAGLAPFADDSGGAQGPRHIRGGRGHVRGALYWAALAAARHDQQLSAFYRRLRANAKKPKVALTAVMRKLVILANTLLKEDRLWTPTRP